MLICPFCYASDTSSQLTSDSNQQAKEKLLEELFGKLNPENCTFKKIEIILMLRNECCVEEKNLNKIISAFLTCFSSNQFEMPDKLT